VSAFTYPYLSVITRSNILPRHNVLHDWSNAECQKILTQIKEAMEPGYSRLLINETVLALSSAPMVRATDLLMMSVNAGAERKYCICPWQFGELLNAAI